MKICMGIYYHEQILPWVFWKHSIYHIGDLLMIHRHILIEEVETFPIYKSEVLWARAHSMAAFVVGSQPYWPVPSSPMPPGPHWIHWNLFLRNTLPWDLSDALGLLANWEMQATNWWVRLCFVSFAWWNGFIWQVSDICVAEESMGLIPYQLIAGKCSHLVVVHHAGVQRRLCSLQSEVVQ